MALRVAPWFLGSAALLAAGACEGSVQTFAPAEFVAVLTGNRFETTSVMRASIEMQMSGEPFATALGYNLCGFDRQLARTDQYSAACNGDFVTDPLGYALAVESFEYAKQPMNNLGLESGAGLSLMFGPVLNPAQQVGQPAHDLLASRFQQLAAEANASGPAGSEHLIVSPAPPLNILNFYGWPGLWPVFAEFEDFDPTIQPQPGPVNQCTFSGFPTFSHGAPPMLDTAIANYECDYNSLNLPNRDAQVDKILTPEALGYATWKQGLAVMGYWATLQDSAGNRITGVDAGDLSQVGQPGNQVVGTFSDPDRTTPGATLPGQPGVYLGDDPMEGWQGLTFQEEVDNKAALLLGSLLTADGATLTIASALAATNYDFESPQVVETPTAQSPILADSLFPQPTSLSIASGSSELSGASGLIGGFAEVFAWTDANNPAVGGSVPFLATYDGDPFPQDDGLPDGEQTLHDRALGILKIAVVDLDRLHRDVANQVLVDTATVTNGAVARGSAVTTVELGEAIIALRNASRALSSQLQAGIDTTPDSAGQPGLLDSTPLAGAPFSETFQQHLATLIVDEADFLSSRLVAPDGSVANGYNLEAELADTSPTNLESELAALRGLLEAYLATSNTSYRELATAVYGDLQSRFWLSGVRCFVSTVGSPDDIEFTPLRFGLLTGALRQYYLLVASDPAHSSEGQQLLAELERMYKLVLNGWDDQNGDNQIQYPTECLTSRLEMGERALTGELGHPADFGDRDHDCVMELSFVGLPAALGATLELARP